eukprot:6254570-Prorocentrum_lima.AAC.1
MTSSLVGSEMCIRDRFLKAVREMQKAKAPRQETARGKRAVATQVKIAALQGTAWFEHFVDLGTEVVTVELGQGDVDLSKFALITLPLEDERHFKSCLLYTSDAADDM